MSATPTVRAVTYCRISHDPTGMEAGVDRQRVDTDRLAEERGWLVVQRVVDNDRSASRYARRSREGWVAVMELVEAGEVEAVVAYDLDRLTRQPKELERLIDAAEKGLAVVTAGGLIDLATAGGRMVARTLCAVAAHEADRVRDRIKAKLRHDAENGRPHWVRRPFGYNLDGSVVADEAKWMREIHRWIIDDGVSATEAARRLNAAGVAQATGSRWQSSGLKALVTSPRNAGMRTYHGKIVGRGTWPAIVSEAEWKAATSALAVRSQGTRSGRRSMMTGMVKCGVCGCTMTRTNTSDRAEWRCMKRVDAGTGCGQSHMAVPLEAHVVEMVLVRIGEVRSAVVTPASGQVADDIRAELQQLADMVARGELSMAEWKVMREPLTTRLSAAEAALVRHDADAALARMVGSTATLAERWAEIEDVDLKRRIMGLVLDHVTVMAARRRGHLDLDRIVPTWKGAVAS